MRSTIFQPPDNLTNNLNQIAEKPIVARDVRIFYRNVDLQ